jgi:hypothetical protein
MDSFDTLVTEYVDVSYYSVIFLCSSMFGPTALRIVQILSE